MKIIVPLCAALAAALVLTGCVTAGKDFDEAQVLQIKKGTTTEADLTRMFGKPVNRAVTSDGAVTLTWSYYTSHAKGTTFIPVAGMFMGGANVSGKTLTVMLGPDGTVTNYYSSGGEM